MGSRAISRAGAARSRLRDVAESADRQRRRLGRSPLARRVGLRRLTWWAVAAVVAWTVADQVTTAQATVAEWGQSVAVLVTTREMSSGDLIAADSVRVEHVPARFVPDDALDSLPPGRRVNAPLAAGEMVLSTRLGASGAGRTGATLPRGSEAVTIAPGSAAAPVQPGEVVDVFAVTVDPVLAKRVARHAVVLRVSPTAVTLAVRPEEVRPTVGAAATQQLSLVIADRR